MRWEPAWSRIQTDTFLRRINLALGEQKYRALAKSQLCWSDRSRSMHSPLSTSRTVVVATHTTANSERPTANDTQQTAVSKRSRKRENYDGDFNDDPFRNVAHGDFQCRHHESGLQHDSHFVSKHGSYLRFGTTTAGTAINSGTRGCCSGYVKKGGTRARVSPRTCIPTRVHHLCARFQITTLTHTVSMTSRRL